MYYIDYKELVFQDYLQKKAKHTLASGLIHPTTAALKTECRKVIVQRYNRKDERVLKDFFEDFEEETGWDQTIEFYNPDKFRPLVNYLKGKVSEPDPKIVELLAWLIDFEDRPFVFGRKYGEPKTLEGIKEGDPKGELKEESEEYIDSTSPNNDETGNITDPLPVETPTIDPRQNIQTATSLPTSLHPPEPGGIKRVVATLVCVLLVVIGMLWLFRNDTAGLGKCMYWAGDHYESVSYNHKFGDDTVLIPWDSKLTNFKKITRQDTITSKDIGHVWYARIDMQHIECYTSDGYGYLPTDPQRRLKPITGYIINKYIMHRDSTAQQATK